MISRIIEKEVKSTAKKYPVILITGPRQSGKTTLAKLCFPDKKYFNLEDPGLSIAASEDPNGFISNIKEGAILDEIQRVPALLHSIQVEADSRKKKGRFILTGSNQFSLIHNVSQSLAGRIGILKLLPMTINETLEFKKINKIDTFLHHGFYPGIYSNKLDPYKAYRNYYETYIERDLRQRINIKDLRKFHLFIRLCAGRIGQLFNASNLSNEVGVSVPTIQHWVSVLEASFIIFFLQPWHTSTNKRLVKTPKIYFIDTGIANYLLGNESENHTSTHPGRGALFENMIILELLKKRYNKGLENNLFFYRDNHQNEVDIIEQVGSHVNTFEVKSSQTFHSDFLKGLNFFRSVFTEQVKIQTLIYAGNENLTINNINIKNYLNL